MSDQANLAKAAVAVKARRAELAAAIAATKAARDLFMEEEMHPFTVRERAYAAEIKALQEELGALEGG